MRFPGIVRVHGLNRFPGLVGSFGLGSLGLMRYPGLMRFPGLEKSPGHVRYPGISGTRRKMSYPQE